MSRFIKRKIEVKDSGYTEVYIPGSQHVPEFRLDRTNLFFIGLRGSGKSTLARDVAEALDGVFVDLDERIIQQAGSSIETIVRSRGWDGFRALEQDCLQEVCGQQGQVVAIGGGCVLLPANRERLKANGRVVYLQADVSLLARRLQQDPLRSKRPPLSDLPLEEELARSLREREPLYFECLDYILQADKPVDALVKDVLTMLKPGSAGFQDDESLDFEPGLDEEWL